jgi:tRNA(fMet)-specific endonuclease VapC
LDEAINDDDDVAIAAVTVAELLMGVTLADTKHQTDRATFVDGVLDAVPVLPYAARARGVPTI